MYQKEYDNYTAALEAAQDFERSLSVENRQTIKYISSSKLNASAKRTYKGVLNSVLVDLVNAERAEWLATQIQDRFSGWQSTDYARDINGLRYTFIKVNRNGTFSVYFKGYPVYENEGDNPFKNLGVVRTDNVEMPMSRDAFDIFKQRNYIPSALLRTAEPVYFINLNICNVRLE